MLTHPELCALLAEPGAPVGLIADALEGDLSATIICRDFAEEAGLVQSPFEVGESYLFETVTMFWVGRVAEIGLGWVRLEEASWVHWTGRLSTLVRRMSFGRQDWPEGDRRPRTEYVGPWWIWTSSLQSHGAPGIELPKESVVS